MISELSLQIILYIASFALVWLGAGLAITSIQRLSQSWHISPFFVSFFFLGILTSLPEMIISSVALVEQKPAIFAGTLLGGTIVLFLGIIPLLGVLGNGVQIPQQLKRNELIYTLLLVLSPAFLSADQRISPWEGVLLMVLYAFLFTFFSARSSIAHKMKKIITRKRRKSSFLLLKAGLGVAILALASNQIVQSTVYFSSLWNISPFFVSLVVVALGTNIPEISLGVRAILNGQKGIAVADYLGSASANTLLFGIFSIIHGKTILLPNHFLQRFVFLAAGLILFFIFARSRKTLSRAESVILLSLYLGFVLFELLYVAGTN